MKKILSILLALLLVFSLAACSDNTSDANDSNTNIGNQNQENNKYDDNEEYAPGPIEWELKDISINVPEVKIETFTVDGRDETFEVGVTIYDTNGNDVIEILKNNQFVSQNYDIRETPSWSEHGFLYDYETDNGDVYNTHYVITESVYNPHKDRGALFVSVGRDTNELKSNDGIYLSFSQLTVNKQTQQNTFSVLKDFVGEEMASYLVYAKDSDGKRHDEELSDEFQLYEEIPSGKFVYVLERTLKQQEYGDDITYYININKTNDLNWLFESNHDYESKYPVFKYPVEKIFPSVGKIDLSNHTDVLKDYYLIGSEDKYAFSTVDNLALDYNHSIYQGVVSEEYRYSLDSNKTDLDSYFQNEDLNVTYSCEDKDGKLINLYIDLDGDIEFDDQKTEEEILAMSKNLIQRKLTYILSDLDVDLSTIKFGESVEITGKYKHELVKGEWEYTLTVDLTCKYDDEIAFDFEWRSWNE